eukprot:12846460-Ditylum_brightwellii.AAC.1
MAVALSAYRPCLYGMGMTKGRLMAWRFSSPLVGNTLSSSGMSSILLSIMALRKTFNPFFIEIVLVNNGNLKLRQQQVPSYNKGDQGLHFDDGQQGEQVTTTDPSN